jgi:hypothetical protein
VHLHVATTQAGSIAQEGRSDHLGRSNYPRGWSDRPGRSHGEASKGRTRDIFARVALELRRLAVDVHPSDSAELKNSKIALEGLVSVAA